jgi:hypothetical protein
LAVEKLLHGAAHLIQAQIAFDIPLKDVPGFRRWHKPLHAYAGKRVLNFSFALYPRLIEGRYGHLDKPLKYLSILSVILLRCIRIDRVNQKVCIEYPRLNGASQMSRRWRDPIAPRCRIGTWGTEPLPVTTWAAAAFANEPF